MNHSEKAKELFTSGYNCAQAVFGAFDDITGIPFEMSLKLASSFGGGMGGLRSTCGAVTGMFMVIGCVCGYNTTENYSEKVEHYARVRKLAEEFQNKNKSLQCRELLSSLSENLKQNPSIRTKEYYKVRPCLKFVLDAVEILDKELSEFES